jgi:hypothetical protein
MKYLFIHHNKRILIARKYAGMDDHYTVIGEVYKEGNFTEELQIWLQNQAGKKS